MFRHRSKVVESWRGKLTKNGFTGFINPLTGVPGEYKSAGPVSSLCPFPIDAVFTEKEHY
jgi:hypothetical protein